MRPLVAVRRAVPFDPAFLSRHPLLLPLARASEALGPLADFPDPQQLTRAFEDGARVRFVPARPRRRRGEPVDRSALYDARIAVEGQVPTRERCWHDFMNALVWATFPRAKRALHARQHAAIERQLGPTASRLPPARSRELDALALLDEGGVAVTTDDPAVRLAMARQASAAVLDDAVARGAADVVVFGHAIYESLVLGVRPAVVAAVLVQQRGDESDRLRAVDEGLARIVADPAALRSPAELVRIDLRQAVHSAGLGAAANSRTA